MRALRPSFSPSLLLFFSNIFFLDFIDSLHPRCDFFSPPPLSLSLSLSLFSSQPFALAVHRPAVTNSSALRRARPAARFGQFAAESGEHSRFNYTDNEVCSDQMPKG